MLYYCLGLDEMQDVPLAEQKFASGSFEQDSLVLILLVVGFFLIKLISFQVSKRECPLQYVRRMRGWLNMLLTIVIGRGWWGC